MANITDQDIQEKNAQEALTGEHANGAPPEVDLHDIDQKEVDSILDAYDKKFGTPEFKDQARDISNENIQEFNSMTEYLQWDKNVWQPSEDVWNEDEEVRAQYLAANDDDEEEARKAFLEQRLEMLKELKAEDHEETENAQIRAEIGLLWGPLEDVTFIDEHETFVFTDYQTQGGERQYGDWWTKPTRSIREYQSQFSTGYINDQGEWVEHKDGEVFLADLFEGTMFDQFFDDDGESVMKSKDPRHKAKDGRSIIGFEYIASDSRARMRPGLKAIYEGDTAQGEMVSRFDFTDTLGLRSNYLDSNPFTMIPKSVGRTLVNTTIDLVSGFATVGLIADRLAGRETVDNEKFLQTMKSLRVSTSDYDQQNLVTMSNMFDLAFQIAAQLAIAGGTGGATNILFKVAKIPMMGLKLGAKGIKTGMGMGTANLMASRLTTGFVYGTMGAHPVREEALAQGFSEDAADALFIAYALTIGAIGGSSNLMPFNIENRVLNATTRQVTKPMLAWAAKEETKKKVGKNMFTFKLAKKMQKRVKKALENNAVRMRKTEGGASRKARWFAAGAEESVEEFAEQIGEYSLKGLLSVAPMAGINVGEGIDGKGPSFKLANTAEFWETVPAELMMSLGAGFAGGVMGKWIMKSNRDILPFTGTDEDALYKLAHYVNSGDPNAIRAEKLFFQRIQKMHKSGALGSHKLSTKTDKTGEFIPMGLNDKQISQADGNLALIRYQYDLAKTQMGTLQVPYEQWLQLNPGIKEQISNNDFLYKKVQKLVKTQNGIFSQVNPELQKKDEDDNKPKRKKLQGGKRGKSKKDADDEKKKKKEKVDKDAEKESKKAKDDEQKEAEKEAKENEEAKQDDDTTDKGKDSGVTKAEVDAYNQELEDDKESAAQDLAKTTDLDIVRAREAVDIEMQIDDHLNGRMTEAMYFKGRIPPAELADLYKSYPQVEAYGDMWMIKMLQADHKRITDEIAEYNLFQEKLANTDALIDKAKSVEEMLKIIDENKDGDGVTHLSPDSLKKINSIVYDLIDKSLSDKEIAVIQNKIIKDNDLFDLAPEGKKSLTGKDKLVDEIAALNDDLQALDTELDKQEKETLQKPDRKKAYEDFIDDNKTRILKITNSIYVRDANTPTKLRSLELDQNGNGLVTNIKHTQIGEDPQWTFISNFITSRTQFVLKQTTMDTDRKQPFGPGDPTYNKVYDTALAWDKLKRSDEISEKMPSEPGEDLIDLVIRDFDASNPHKVSTQSAPLFNIAVDDNPLISDKVKYESSVMGDLQRQVKTIVPPQRDAEGKFIPGSGSYIFRNIKGAKALLGKLKARKLVLDLFTDPGVIQDLAKLREFNAKTYNNIEYHKDISDDDVTAYSKWFAFYVVDPIAYAEKMRRAQNDTLPKRGALARKYKRMDDRMMGMEIAREAIHREMQNAEELIAMAEQSNTAANRYKEYILTTQEEIDTMAEQLDFLTTFYGEDADSDIKIPAEVEEALRVAQLEVLKAQEDDPTPAELENALAHLRKVARMVYTLDPQLKKKILQDTRLHGAFKLRAYLTTDYAVFHKYYRNIIKTGKLEHRPNMSQESAAFIAFAALINEEVRDANGDVLVPSMLDFPGGTFKWAIYVDGFQGTGKSTMVSMAAAMAESYLIDKYSGTEHADKTQVMLSGMVKEQIDTLHKATKELEINNAQPPHGGSADNSSAHGFTAREVYAKLMKDDINDADKEFEKIGVILMDEATHIQGGHSISPISNTDMGRMLEQIDKINALRSARGQAPLRILFMGDRDQGGWRKKMPTLESPQDTDIDYNELGEPNNIGEAVNAGAPIVSPTRLKMSFRFNVAEIGIRAQELAEIYTLIYSKKIGAKVKGQSYGAPTSITTHYGVVADSDSGSLGGIETTSEVSNIYNDPTLAENIQRQFDENPNFTLTIVDDKLYKTGVWPEGAVASLLQDSNYRHRVNIHSILSVQGSEANYVLAVLPPGFLPKLSDATPANAYNYKLLSMLVGRAKDYVRITIPSTVNIHSKPRADMEMMDSRMATEIEEKWKELHDKLLDAGMEDVDTEEIKPDDPNIRPPGPKPPGPKPKNDDAGGNTGTITVSGDGKVTKGSTKVGSPDWGGGKVILPESDKNKLDYVDSINISEVEDKIREIAKEAGVAGAESLNTADILTQLDIIRSDPKTTPEQKVLADTAVEAILMLRTKFSNVDIRKGDGDSNLYDFLFPEDISKPTYGESLKPKKWRFKVQEAWNYAAEALDKIGRAIGYTHFEKEYDKQTASESTKTRHYYAFDLYGPKYAVPAERIQEHTDLASAAAGDPTTMNNYDYEMVSYEFFYKGEVKIAHAIVATVLQGPDQNKKLLLVNFPSHVAMEKATNLGKFLSKRQEELEILQRRYDHFLAALPDDQTKLARGKAFPVYQTEREKLNDVKKGFQHLGESPKSSLEKDAAAHRHTVVDGEVRPYGMLHVSIKITNAVREGAVFEGQTIGEIVTASTGIATLLGQDGNVNMKGLAVNEGQRKAKVTAFTSIINKLKDQNQKIVPSNMFVNQKVYRYINPKKASNNGYVVYVKGYNGEADPIPIHISNTGAVNVFFGVTKDGDLITGGDPDKKYTPAIDLIVKSLRQYNSAATRIENGGVTEIGFDELREETARQMRYKLEDLDATTTGTERYRLASNYTLNEMAYDLASAQITLRRLKELIKQQYSETGNPDHVQLSRPISFSKGPFAGRSFILYSSVPEVDLTTIDGVAREVAKLNFLEKAYDPNDPAKNDPQKVLENLLNRQGIGVVMLDYPKLTFKEAAEAIKKTDRQTHRRFNRSTVSINSDTKKYFMSGIAQLAWEIKSELEETNDTDIPNGWAGKSTSRLENIVSKLGTPEFKMLFKPEEIRAIAQELIDAAKAPTIEGKAARNLIASLASMTLDRNMGHFIRQEDTVVSDDAGNVLGISSAILRDKNGDPIINLPDEGAMKFMTPDLMAGSDLVEDFSGFDLAQFIRLLSGESEVSLLHTDRSLEEELKESVGDETVAIFGNLISRHAIEDTMKDGFFMSPAYNISSEWDSDAVLLENHPDLDLVLSTTAKGISEPSLIINIRNLERGVEDAYTSASVVLEENEKAEKAVISMAERYRNSWASLIGKQGTTNEDVVALKALFDKELEELEKAHKPETLAVQHIAKRIAEMKAATDEQYVNNKGRFGTKPVIQSLASLRGIKGGKYTGNLKNIPGKTDDINQLFAEIAFLTLDSDTLRAHTKLIREIINSMDPEYKKQYKSYLDKTLKALDSLTTDQINADFNWDEMMAAYDASKPPIDQVDPHGDLAKDVRKGIDSYNNGLATPRNVLLVAYNTVGTDAERAKLRKQIMGPFDSVWVNRSNIMWMLTNTNWPIDMNTLSEAVNKDSEFLNSDHFVRAWAAFTDRVNQNLADLDEIMNDFTTYVAQLKSNTKITDFKKELGKLHDAISLLSIDDAAKKPLLDLIAREMGAINIGKLSDILEGVDFFAGLKATERGKLKKRLTKIEEHPTLNQSDIYQTVLTQLANRTINVLDFGDLMTAAQIEFNMDPADDTVAEELVHLAMNLSEKMC